MKFKRALVLSVTAATSQTIQMPQSGKIVGVLFSVVTAAAGSWELSTSSTSQIATGSPDTGVKARLRIGATAGMQNVFVPLELPVRVLDNYYIHTTGAGNVGELCIYLN
jgi:hypothetical protein